ncbi:kallikrein-14-like [Grus americana]|uniref:kallikrein-14-like n=1 Tax=Grus americana TaxID=9117 RepID=UPI002407EAD5|nr:kallikrein-14-like [Grus americana]
MDVAVGHHVLFGGLRLRLGENDLQQREGTEQDRLVVKVIPHPAFDPTTLDNDLMLLKLNRPVGLGRAVRPLPLPRACAAPGTTCLVSGWGTVTTPQVTLPRHLICAYVDIIPDATCRRAYPQRVTPNMLCAGVRNQRIDSCQVRRQGGGHPLGGGWPPQISTHPSTPPRRCPTKDLLPQRVPPPAPNLGVSSRGVPPILTSHSGVSPKPHPHATQRCPLSP